MGELATTTMYVLWAAAIVLFGVLEAVTAQLVSIWFMIGSIGAFIAALCGGTFKTQMIVFLAITVLALAVTRPLVKKYIKPKIERTNADRVINQTGVVVEEINNLSATGQVKVDGKLWTARSDNNSIIPCDSLVTIKEIQGVKLIVTTNNN
ncbi:MAG: NfeD family protein [Clostridiales bacterium]|nr:NfeD family protein [Clostridiales bacterium]